VLVGIKKSLSKLGRYENCVERSVEASVYEDMGDGSIDDVGI